MNGSRQQALIDVLEANAEAVVDFFRALTAEQLSTLIYTEGNHWTARDLLAHLAGAERSLLSLFRNVAGGGPGTTPDFDLDYYNRRVVEKTVEASVDDLLATFQQRRADTVAFTAALPDDVLDNVGNHPTEGQRTLEGLIAITYEHTGWHIRDIRRALGLPE